MGASAFAAHGALAQTALEQDMRYQDTATMTVGETMISLGGGFAYLTLPDTRFTFRYKDGGTFNTAASRRTTLSTIMAAASPARSRPRFGGAFGMPWDRRGHGLLVEHREHQPQPLRQHQQLHLRSLANIVDTPGLSTSAPAPSSRHGPRRR